jgi:hypothetical protein
MTLGSLTHISLMKRCYKITPKTWTMTCSHFLPNKVLKGKLYFLTTSSECFYLVHILFYLLDVKCNWWVMHACLQFPLDSAKDSIWQIQSWSHGLIGYGQSRVEQHESNATEVISIISALYRPLSLISSYQVFNNSFVHFLCPAGFGHVSEGR